MDYWAVQSVRAVTWELRLELLVPPVPLISSGVLWKTGILFWGLISLSAKQGASVILLPAGDFLSDSWERFPVVDGYVHVVDCGDGFMGVYICQNLSNGKF